MRTELEKTLDQLHLQLQDVSELDDEQRDRLRAAVDQIKASLDESEVNSHSLATGLQAATQSFSDAHPKLAENLGRVADMLSQMGI
jgi:septal ring factor EnvC (AmiA/AmiB activator)